MIFIEIDIDRYKSKIRSRFTDIDINLAWTVCDLSVHSSEKCQYDLL